LDEALCNGEEAASPTDLPAPPAGVLPGFGFGPAADFASAFRPSEDLGDFLRNILDIRLPFVAFSGSIITALWPLFGKPDSVRQLGKSDRGQGYGYKVFDARLSTR
jgi:hypothetical protein